MEAICDDGVPAPGVECSLDHINPCEPVSDVTCVSLGPDVDLGWTNNDNYGEIRIYRDASLIATIPGKTTISLPVSS